MILTFFEASALDYENAIPFQVKKANTSTSAFNDVGKIIDGKKGY